MFARRKRTWLSAGFAAAVLASSAAHATVLEWSFTFSLSPLITGKGTLFTDVKPVNGSYLVTSLTGTLDDNSTLYAMSLVPADEISPEAPNFYFSDNEITPGAILELDKYGLGFATNDLFKTEWAIWNSGEAGDNYSWCNNSHLHLSYYCSFADDPTGLGSFTTQFLAAVPEASDWSMMLVGFASLGLAGYFRKKPAENVARGGGARPS